MGEAGNGIRRRPVWAALDHADVVFGLVLPDKEWKRDAVTQDALLDLIEPRCRQLF